MRGWTHTQDQNLNPFQTIGHIHIKFKGHGRKPKCHFDACRLLSTQMWTASTRVPCAHVVIVLFLKCRIHNCTEEALYESGSICTSAIHILHRGKGWGPQYSPPPPHNDIWKGPRTFAFILKKKFHGQTCITLSQTEHSNSMLQPGALIKQF